MLYWDVNMINKILDYIKYGKMNDNIVRYDYIELKEDAAAEAWERSIIMNGQNSIRII